MDRSYARRERAPGDGGGGMERDELLTDTFVVLADTLIDDFDVIDFLQMLAERCVELLDISAAGVMLSDGAGGLRHAACSSEQMRLVELFELQVGEGPCFDAFRDRTAVRHDDLSDDATPWPDFAAHAVGAGFLAVSAVPMRLRVHVVGALNLFSATPPALGPTDLRVAQAMADVATIGILQERAISDGRDLAGHLQGALRSRIVIEQAKGIVAESRHISVDEAFAEIRAYARNHNHLLGATAGQIVSGQLRSQDLVSPLTIDDRA